MNAIPRIAPPRSQTGTAAQPQQAVISGPITELVEDAGFPKRIYDDVQPRLLIEYSVEYFFEFLFELRR